ncbi:hypothetical protein P4C99_04020 [Pontiellaceae bacterium B1224]|nr:hypothetical protein [Pontiellaceae bacterium B1224]
MLKCRIDGGWTDADHNALELAYRVGATTNLISSSITHVTEEAGSSPFDAKYEIVTNRVPTDVEAQQFMQLNVSAE